VPALGGAVCFDAHGLAQGGVGRELLDVACKVVRIESAGDEAGDSVGDEVLRTALVGYDAGHSAGQRLEDAVSESVVGAREEEHVCGCKRACEFQAREVAGKYGGGEQAAQFFQIRTIAYEN